MPTDQPHFEHVTDKAELIRLRDTEQRSWKAVADALGLGSPGRARRVYSAVVRPHTESILVARSVAKVEPVALDGLTVEKVRKAIAGRTIIVERKNGTEQIPVAKVTSIKDGTINFHDGNKARSVKATAVVACK
jgi:hypothetical protein